MAMCGKPDATGRSSGKLVGRKRKLNSPPDEPWGWLSQSLLESDAWRSLSLNALRVLHVLMLEHMAHHGGENGNLAVTYDDFQRYGIRRGSIRMAIEEAIEAGLIARTNDGGGWPVMRTPARYRLEWLPDKDGTPATNRWKSVTKKQMDRWRERRKQDEKAKRARRKKRNAGYAGGTTIVTPVTLEQAHGAKPSRGETAEIRQSRLARSSDAGVTPFYISGSRGAMGWAILFHHPDPDPSWATACVQEIGRLRHGRA